MRQITKEEMDAIGARHGIHPRYRTEFLKLANKGRIDDKRFGDRLHTSSKYQAACRELMKLLSQPIRHLFEHPQFQLS